jgi:hypothetical protein
MKRPTFFISSTIYDFSDLRSAIKYFLEQQGCDVLASEYNDFRKPLDVHSYQACLDTIHQADYFILLVGARVGGWYDKENRISITQKEYREAYNLHVEGRLKILNFVRSDIWNLRADRIELENYLKTLDIDTDTTNSIKNHPTKRANSPEFIVNFLNEICRNKETKDALNGKSQFPSGNWLHAFNSFRDIADVLQPEVFDGVPIDEAIMRRLLLSELREVLRKSLVKFKEGAIYSPTITIKDFYHEHKLERNISEEHYTSVNTKRWDQLATLAIGLLGVKLNPLILPQALSSSAFLRFDSGKGAFEEEPVYDALHLLQQEINLLTKGNTSETLSVIYEHTPRHRYADETTIRVKSIKLFAFLHLLLRWSNVITLSKSIIQYLEGSTFVMPKIFEKSPIPSMNKEIEKETVTQEDVSMFINE